LFAASAGDPIAMTVNSAPSPILRIIAVLRRADPVI
jgi:hypothetical protein